MSFDCCNLSKKIIPSAILSHFLRPMFNNQYCGGKYSRNHPRYSWSEVFRVYGLISQIFNGTALRIILVTLFQGWTRIETHQKIASKYFSKQNYMYLILHGSTIHRNHPRISCSGEGREETCQQSFWFNCYDASARLS